MSASAYSSASTASGANTTQGLKTATTSGKHTSPTSSSASEATSINNESAPMVGVSKQSNGGSEGILTDSDKNDSDGVVDRNIDGRVEGIEEGGKELGIVEYTEQDKARWDKEEGMSHSGLTRVGNSRALLFVIIRRMISDNDPAIIEQLADTLKVFIFWLITSFS